jgi:hypothetical protein
MREETGEVPGRAGPAARARPRGPGKHGTPVTAETPDHAWHATAGHCPAGTGARRPLAREHDPAGLDYWILPRRTSRPGSSPGDHSGPLPARAPVPCQNSFIGADLAFRALTQIHQTDTDDHDALRLTLAITAAHRPRRLLAPHMQENTRSQRQ